MSAAAAAAAAAKQQDNLYMAAAAAHQSTLSTHPAFHTMTRHHTFDPTQNDLNERSSVSSSVSSTSAVAASLYHHHHHHQASVANSLVDANPNPFYNPFYPPPPHHHVHHHPHPYQTHQPPSTHPAVIAAAAAAAASISSSSTSSNSTTPSVSSAPSAASVSSSTHHTEIDIDPRELELFAEKFKQRRIKLGVTQADVGQQLSKLKLPGVGSLSQSTICRFESLTLSHNNMIALKPVLHSWLEQAEAEARHKKRNDDAPSQTHVTNNQQLPSMSNISNNNTVSLSNANSTSSMSSGSSNSSASSGSSSSNLVNMNSSHHNSHHSHHNHHNNHHSHNHHHNTSSHHNNSSQDRKRKRTSIATPEKRSLEAYFALQPRPSGEKIAQIAEKLDLKKNVVRVWFCNQRQKQKRMKFAAIQGR